MAAPTSDLPRAATLARFTVAARRWALPDTSVDLAWTSGRVDVIGPMSSARPTRYAVGTEVTLLSLDPVAAAEWLAVPLRELVDAVVPLNAISERLAATLSSVFDTGMAAELVGLAGERPATRVATATRLLSAGARVAGVATAVNLSERQLERDFERVTGHAPKRFARIVRLRRAVKAAKRGVPLAETAVMTGYADQSHFAREVKALTGRTPLDILPVVGNLQDLSPPSRLSAPHNGERLRDAL